MTTPELLQPTRTERQARAEIAAADRRSWYPGTRALSSHGIISNRDSREVARCASRIDRDNIVAMARAFDDMRAALIGLLPASSTRPTVENEIAHWEREKALGNGQAVHVLAAYDALLKASGVRP